MRSLSIFLTMLNLNKRILMLSITEANQNFSKVTRLVDERGTAVILKNNVPRYLVIDFSKADENAIASDEDVLAISKRFLAQNMDFLKQYCLM